MGRHDWNRRPVRAFTFVATRFAVAIYILLLLASGMVDGPATSLRMAQSVNINPVVVRRITGLLARAGLVRVKRGPGRAKLMRAPEEITLGDIWQAVNPGGCRPLLPVHGNPNAACVVGCSVHSVLGDAFAAAEAAMHAFLCQTTLASLVAECWLLQASRQRSVWARGDCSHVWAWCRWTWRCRHLLAIKEFAAGYAWANSWRFGHR